MVLKLPTLRDGGREHFIGFYVNLSKWNLVVLLCQVVFVVDTCSHKLWNTILSRCNSCGPLIFLKKICFLKQLFRFFILYCLLQTEFRVLFSCVFLSLAALVTVVPTSVPPPLLRWFSFLLDCVPGELIWVKNTHFLESFIFLKWDQLHDPDHHAVSWRAVLALLGQCSLGCWVKFWFPEAAGWRKWLGNWCLLYSMLVQSSRIWILQKEERKNMHTSSFSPFCLHILYFLPTSSSLKTEICHLFHCLLQSSIVFCRLLWVAHHP